MNTKSLSARVGFLLFVRYPAGPQTTSGGDLYFHRIKGGSCAAYESGGMTGSQGIRAPLRQNAPASGRFFLRRALHDILLRMTVCCGAKKQILREILSKSIDTPCRLC